MDVSLKATNYTGASWRAYNLRPTSGTRVIWMHSMKRRRKSLYRKAEETCEQLRPGVACDEKKQTARHCRQPYRNPEEMKAVISPLLEIFKSVKDVLWPPVLRSEINAIWKDHVRQCNSISDPNSCMDSANSAKGRHAASYLQVCERFKFARKLPSPYQPDDTK